MRRVIGLLASSLLTASALTVGGVLAAAPAQAAPLVGPCADLVTFDDDNDGWRFATMNANMTVRSGPVAAGWNAAQGNPGGALFTTDPDSGWSEVWSPPLEANGFDTDYSGLVGGTLQFDYRNDTGIGYNLYLAVWGENGQRMFYNFRPQITNSQAWNRVRVPLDPTLWRTGFSNSTGVNMSSPAPTADAFEAILSDVQRFAISVEGRNGSDTTFVDNFGGSCEDQGDALDSYGTIGGEAAAHSLADYDAAGGTAALMMGDRVDHEPAGVPSAAADGDDLDNVADEDGVMGPIVVTGGVPTTVPVRVSNATTEPATLVGWIDADGNGAFEADERSTVVTVPAGADETVLDVDFGAAPALAQDTFARFRLFGGVVADPLPTGPAYLGEVEDHVAAAADPGMSLVKDGVLADANGNGVADVGETVDYTFTATNTGNTPLVGVGITDSRITTGISPATQNMPLFGQRTFTAAYAVTQADIDAGSLVNVATAAGTTPSGTTVGSNQARDELPTLDRDPSLALEKSGTLADINANGLADVGELITYAFEVENTGNVTVQDVTIDDSRVAGVTPGPVTLAPGDSQTFTAASYVVTQADLLIGEVYNVATATGTSPLGSLESPPSEERVDTADPNPGLEIIKTGELTADVNGNELADAGDTMTYTFAVENIGDVDLVDVTVDDPRVSELAPASQDVAAGQTVEFTGTLVVTQADVDAGVIRNSATATGTFEGPDGDVPVGTPPSTFDFDTVPPVPGLEIVKTGELTTDANGNGLADVGDTIVYAFLVENTGNTTLVNVQVEDPKLAALGILPAPITLAPGEDDSLTTAPYVVTQADVDAGVVANSATARGNVPNGPETTSPPDDFDVPTPEAAPDLEIEKTASLQDQNGNGTADAGESVIYSFAVTNTGNVTMLDVSVVDEQISGLVPESVDVLAPGITAAFIAEPYVVTAEDVAAGELVNVATAVGTAPDGAAFESDPDEVATTVTPPPPGAGESDRGGLLPAAGSPAGLGLIAAALAALAAGGYLVRRRRTGTHAA